MKLLSRVRDALRFAINQRRYDFKNSRQPEQLSFAKLKHVVVSKMDGKLGDSQVMTPFFTELRRAFPEVKISVLCSQNVAPIYRDCLQLDGVYVVPKRPSAQALDAVCAQIEKVAPCDLLITLEGYFRFQDFYLAHKLHPDFVAGIAAKVQCININLEVRNREQHITAYFADLLRLGGVKEPVISYNPLVSAASEAKAAQYCRKPQLAFAPWGASRHKHLSDEVVKALLKVMGDQSSANIALLVPPEGNYLQELAKTVISSGRLIAIPAKMDCLELASIINHSCALISVDTGNLHLACASQIPLFAIYNGNNSGLNVRWAPLPGKQDVEIFSRAGKMIDELTAADLTDGVAAFIEKYNL